MIAWILVFITLSIGAFVTRNKNDSGFWTVMWCLWIVGSACLWSLKYYKIG